MSQDSALSFSAIKRMANKRTLNTKNRKQSIKFEIELPMNMDATSDYEYTSDYDNDRQNDEQTICFKISMNQCAVTPRTARTTGRPISISSATASSGYSSSISSASSIQGLDQFETSNNKAFSLSNQKNGLFCNENVYDRLNYKTSAKRRSSLASMTSSYESSNQSSECEIYEEIGNFSQVEVKHLFATPKPVKQHVYCNERIETAPKTPKSNIYKRREYTVNEIFQNAQTFQEEATKQEFNVNSRNNTVNPIKKLFESKMKTSDSKKIKENQLKSQSTAQKQNKQTHDYVNEKISAPVFV